MSKPRFEQFFAVRRFPLLTSLTFSPDSQHVAYVHDGSGQMNLWRQPAAGGVLPAAGRPAGSQPR